MRRIFAMNWNVVSCWINKHLATRWWQYKNSSLTDSVQTLRMSAFDYRCHLECCANRSTFKHRAVFSFIFLYRNSGQSKIKKKKNFKFNQFLCNFCRMFDFKKHTLMISSGKFSTISTKISDNNSKYFWNEFFFRWFYFHLFHSRDFMSIFLSIFNKV